MSGETSSSSEVNTSETAEKCVKKEEQKEVQDSTENESEKTSESSKMEVETTAESTEVQDEWFYVKDGERVGPISWEDLCVMGSNTMAWREGIADWMPLSSLKLIALNDAWYYFDETDNQVGPVSKWHLVQLASTDFFTNESLVYKYGSPSQEWLKAGEIEEIRTVCGFEEIKVPIQNEEMPESMKIGEVADQGLEWYYKDNYRQRHGPVNIPELLQMLEKEEIHRTTLIWKAGMDDWDKAETVLFPARTNPAINEETNKTKAEKKKKEEIRHRVLKEISITELKDVDSKVLGTVKQGMVVKILKVDETRCKVKVDASGMEGWIDAEDEGSQSLLERVKASELKKKKKKKKKKRKWKPVKANAVYVSGIPKDMTIFEMEQFFKKCGRVKRDVLTGQVKIKLYTEENSRELKGDGIVHYFKPEAVALAINLLDGADIRPNVTLKVTEATFSCKGDFREKKRQKLTASQRRMKRELERYYMTNSWDDDADKVVPKLYFIILKHMFTLEETKEDPLGEDHFYETLKIEVAIECERVAGLVEKITVFQNNPDGVIAVRFKNPSGAAKCIEVMNGRFFAGRRVEAFYWDGTADYRVKESEEDELKRLEEYSKFLDSQPAKKETAEN